MPGQEFRSLNRRRCRLSRQLHFGHRPKFSEGIRPTEIDNALPGAIAHPLPQCGIDDQRADGAREILNVMRLGYEAVRFVVH